MAQPDAPVPEPDDTTDGSAPAEKVQVGRATTPISQQVGRVAFFVAGAVFVLFALFNWQYVDFNWVFGGTEVISAKGERVTGGVPLIVLLLAAFGLGAIVGMGASARRRKRKGA